MSLTTLAGMAGLMVLIVFDASSTEATIKTTVDASARFRRATPLKLPTAEPVSYIASDTYEVSGSTVIIQ